MGWFKIEVLRGRGSGEWALFLPRKILHFLHQNHTSVMHSYHLYLM